MKSEWPQEARMLIQLGVPIRVARGTPLTGRRLNAGCGEGLRRNNQSGGA
jgi:hypothetical protein